MVFRQERVIKAKNKQKQFVFFPNYTVTSSIFTFFSNLPSEVEHTNGFYGVLKTISSMLYKRLSDNVIDYVI